MLAWTATSDAEWLSASPAFGGNGPTKLYISANSGIRAIGIYTGHVMLSAAGATNSPHVIEVHAEVDAFPGPRQYLPVIKRRETLSSTQ